MVMINRKDTKTEKTFLVKPFKGETLEEFKKRLKKIMLQIN